MPTGRPQVTRLARGRALLIACALLLIAAPDETRYAAARKALLAEIQRDAALTAAATGRGRFGASVMKAVDAVPRHRFVPPGSAAVLAWPAATER